MVWLWVPCAVVVFRMLRTALVVEKLQDFALLLTWCSAEEWANFPEMAHSVHGTYPSCLRSAAQNPLYLSFPGVCKELLLDLLSQKLCKWQCFILHPQKSDYSLDDLLNRALPPCFGCFNGLLMKLSHSPQGGNLFFIEIRMGNIRFWFQFLKS